MSDKLRIAIIGCGAIAYSNAEAIGRSGNARLAIAVDARLEAAEALGKKYSVPFTDRVEEVLSAPATDAVFISTPHYLHAPLAELAAAAGKHVIVEKPMGASLSDSRRIVAACRRAGVKLSVCYCMRYSRKIEFVKRFIDEGGVGDVIGFEITMLRDRSEKYLGRDTWQEGNPNWHGVRAKSGGGIFIDNVSHYLDYVLYLTGLDIEEVYCRAGTFLLPAEVEDNLWAICVAGNGAGGVIAAGSAVRGAGQEQDKKTGNSIQRIWGSHGQVILLPELRVFSQKRAGEITPNRWHTIKPKGIFNSGGAGVPERTRFVQGFARAVAENRGPGIPGSAGERVMEIIDTVYRSAREGRVLRIKEA